MKKLLLYILLLPTLAFGQISKKQMFFYLSQGSATTNEVVNINFTFDLIQYTDEPIVLSATPLGGSTIISYSWQIRNKSGTLVGLSFDRNATINTVTTRGFYDLTFIAKSSTDQYTKTWADMYVDFPRFTEGEADIVINQASGNYYNNFAEADNSGLKIYVKGNGTAQIQFTGLFGTKANPVRVQKAEDNTDITLTCPSGTGHTLYLYANNQWIVFNGFNTDKTIGWNIVGDVGGVQNITAKDGAMKGLQFFGIASVHQTTVNAASFSFIPNTNVTYNAANYVMEDMIVWGCTITNAGEEGIYAGYNSDLPISTYRPPKIRDGIFAWNTISGTGRDAIQPGGAVNVSIHNNYIENWGLQADASHESAISWNGGTYGKCYENYAIGGEMFLNIQSGGAPWDIQAGQTTPQLSEFYGNVFINGTYTGSPGTEPFGVYVQNSGSETTSSANWPVSIYNNTFKTDKKMLEAYFHASSFVWTGFKFVNNVIVKVGTAGDGEDYNFTGPGTQPTGSTINNLVRNNGSESDILFTNYAGNDLTISSLSSPVYTGATDVSSYNGDNDFNGYPLNSGAFAHGAYSGYNKKTVTPSVGDPNPATFSTPLAIGTLTQAGGTITFEANKVGILYWAIVANNATAPTEAQLRAGGHGLASGTILDAGTAGSYVVSTLTEGTAYDLHGIFVTVDNIPQAAVTKVDFTTTADTTAPTVSSMTIADANRDKIVIVFTEPVTGTNAGFTIAGTTSTSFSSISGTGTNTITGTLAVAATYGQSVTLAYSSSTGDLIDLATGPNDLATFGATAVTNNIAAAPQEYVVWTDLSNATAGSNGDIDSDNNSANARSTQIIPSSSGGYVVHTWNTNSRSDSQGMRFGLIGSSDARTFANVDMSLDLRASNPNVDVYEGATYKTTISGGTGIQATGYLHRFRIDRGTNKIYYETSPDGSAWTLRYTHSGTVTGDLRAAYVSGDSSKGAYSCAIQADLGLN